MPSLRIADLHKDFEGKKVVQGVSFEAKAGEVVALIGPSGCGKTTILRCILGEVRPDSGRILIDGEDVTETPVWRRGVGIVYQRYALFPHMTVADNIAYGLKIRRQPPATIKATVQRLLEMVNLQDKGEQYPERLSGGERQRVALARALAVKPRILLLDEAFTALDATTRHRVVQDVRSIVERLKVTTILVTHDQEEAFLFANRVIVVNAGRIVVDGPPDEVMADPHPFIRDFVKMAVFQKGTVEDDGRGGLCVPLESGGRVPIDIPGVKPGDYVQVIVKKTGERETIEVWRRDRA